MAKKYLNVDLETAGTLKGVNIEGNITGNISGDVTATIVKANKISSKLANQELIITDLNDDSSSSGKDVKVSIINEPQSDSILDLCEIGGTVDAQTSRTGLRLHYKGQGNNDCSIKVLRELDEAGGDDLEREIVNSDSYGREVTLKAYTTPINSDTVGTSILLDGPDEEIRVVGDLTLSDGNFTGGLVLPSGKTISGLHPSNNITTAGNITLNGGSTTYVRAPRLEGTLITHNDGEDDLQLSALADVNVILDNNNTFGLSNEFSVYKNNTVSGNKVFTVHDSGDVDVTGDVFTFGSSTTTSIRNNAKTVLNLGVVSGTPITYYTEFKDSDIRVPDVPADTVNDSFSYWVLGVDVLNNHKLIRNNQSGLFTGTHVYKAESDIAPGTAVELVNGSVQATSSANSAICVGIVAQTKEATEDEPIETSLGESLTSGWAIKLASVGDVKHRNSAGFLVCNEGGNIAPGDLLVTSSTAGYLMKQADDIIRSTTVGKAMEAPSFDDNGQASGIYGYIYCG